MSWRPALRFLGRLLAILTAAQLVPLGWCVGAGDNGEARAFIISAVICGFASLLLIATCRSRGQAAPELYRRDGIVIVVGGWLLASMFGALPYILSGTLTNPIDALFETASGFTTTGASVLVDIEAQGRGILLWRSFTQWLGGMGIIVLFVALLPELGAGARFLYRLEVPGPTAETLHAKVHQTAMVLWRIYLLLSLAEMTLLMLAGLDLYDALTHTFSTLSTGGFSPRGASVAAFSSPVVEIIVIAFMLLAGVNFSLYYGAISSRCRNVFRDTEFRIYGILVVIATILIMIDLVSHSYRGGLGRATLDATFQVVSIVTTTGFATADFATWPSFSKITLVALMFVGGCAGSTAGGMKVMRYVIGLKLALREMRMIFSPSSVMALTVGRTPVPGAVARSVAGFFVLFIASWAAGAILLTIGDADLETAATASIAMLSNIGPGLAAVGPMENFAHFPNWQKVVMVLLMWLGRLEIYAILALFTIRFWRR